ncbi:hypothetical protein BIFDEN_00864 [Bifidobacterium dentium ATCC 27678]|nr:hypothetical protein BIFDEN_00864 [Bifidobacterium dentium ATCC 27678]
MQHFSDISCDEIVCDTPCSQTIILRLFHTFGSIKGHPSAWESGDKQTNA